MDAIIQQSSSKLNDSNYHLWRLRTESALKAKDAWIAIAQDDPGNDVASANEKAAWEKACNIAMGYITNTIDDSVLGQFINVTSPRELWFQIKDRYEANNNIRKIELRKKIAALKMLPDEDWSAYIVRATTLGEQAKSLNMDIGEQEITYNIVRGLPARYQILKTTFCAQSEINIDLLKRSLRDHDEQNGRKSESEFAYKAKTVDSQRRNRDGRTNIRCWYCNKQGHKKQDCRKLQNETVAKSKSKETNKSGGSQRNPKTFDARVIQETAMQETHVEQLWFTKTKSGDKQDSSNWILDSGATSHMCCRRDWLLEFEPQRNKVRLADESTAVILGKGTVRFISRETGTRITVRDVLYVPSLRGNLISVGKIVQGTSRAVIFERDKAKVLSETGHTVAIAKNSGEFYTLEVDTLVDEANAVETKKTKVADNPDLSENDEDRPQQVRSTLNGKSDKLLWHKRLNHVNESAMNKLIEQNMIESIEFGKEKLETCHACCTGKLTKLPHRSISHYQSADILELLHMDLCGPFPKESLEGHRYMLTIVDDFSRRIFTYLLKTKDQATERIMILIRTEENKTGKTVKKIRTDNGGEFIGHELKTFLGKQGITHQFTTPYNPQSNGIAERANRTIVEAMRVMLIDSDLPDEFWGEAAKTASYIKNALPTKINGDKTPYEKYCGRKPTAKHFHIFGCLAYYHIPKERRQNKLSPTGKAGIFTGYSRKRAAFRIYNPIEGTFHETKHVRFCENKKGSDILKENIQQNGDKFFYELVQLQASETQRTGDEDIHNDREGRETTQPLRRSERIRLQNQVKGRPVYAEAPSSSSDDEDDDVIVAQDHLTEYKDNNIDLTPRTYEEAMMSPHKDQWLQAMQEEINSLKSHAVWELVKRPKDTKTIPCKWIFKIKRNQDGSVDRFKARLVAVGCAQNPTSKTENIFSPVVRMESLRTLLAIAQMKKFKMKTFDVTTAYLHGHLDEHVTMEQPKGFEELDEEHLVCKLKRGLYGLKQSGRIWFQTLRNHMLSVGFKQLEADQCIFRYKTKDGLLFLAVYVDDFVALGSNEAIIDEGISKITERYTLNETTEKSTILGWNIKWSEEELHLTQESYAKEILKRFEMQNCKPVDTPLVVGQNLNSFEDSPKIDQKLYQEMVGSIMYLMTGTRPDLSFAMTNLSRFLSDPREIHMRAVKRTLRYIKGTTNRGLLYKSAKGQLCGYADASWNDGNGDEKSVSGYVIQIGENTVNWNSRRQRNVSLSTCQSEVTAIADCMKDMIWMRMLLSELEAQACIASPLMISNDNQAAIACTQGIASNNKVRHFNRTVMFIRQQIEFGNYKVKYVASEELCADALTKAVSGQKLQKCVNFLSLK